MDFLKKHYEKVLLGLMLTALVGVLVFMLFYIASDQEAMNEHAIKLQPSGKPLPALDLAVETSAMERLQLPNLLDLETTNKLFNPLEWQKSPDGRIFPISSDKVVGIKAAVVTNIVPLYLILTLDQVTTNEMGARYTIGVENQAATTPVKRHKVSRYISVGDKANEFFSLVAVKGAPDNPDSLILKLVDSGENVTVSHEKPFRRVDAFIADFRYDPERKVFHARRVDDKVSFGGTDYVVVEVKQNELILSDQSNGKKNSLPFTP
jgi:hypothetical protein